MQTPHSDDPSILEDHEIDEIHDLAEQNAIQMNFQNPYPAGSEQADLYDRVFGTYDFKHNYSFD